MSRQRLFTDQKCLETVLRMMEKCPLDEINVDALCLEAGFGRSTFYYHYSSLGAFLADVTRSAVTDALQNLKPESTFTDALDCLMKLTDSHRTIANGIFHSRYREPVTRSVLQALEEESERLLIRIGEKEGKDVKPGRLHFQKEVYARLLLSAVTMAPEDEPERDEWGRQTTSLVGGMLDAYAC